jgi:hypothetical protein
MGGLHTVASFAYGLLGGIIAWIATTIIGQPLYKFISLRSQTAKVLARYDDDGSNLSTIYDANRRTEYADCGADLIAFAATNVSAIWILRKLPKGWRCFPKSAGTNLALSANLQPGYEAEQVRTKIVSALKLNY